VITIVVPFQICHKLNYFLIFRISWILIVSYDKKLKNSCSQSSLHLASLFVKTINIMVICNFMIPFVCVMTHPH